MTKDKLIRFCKDQLEGLMPRYLELEQERNNALGKADRYDGGNPNKHGSKYWLSKTRESQYKFWKDKKEFFEREISYLSKFN